VIIASQSCIIPVSTLKASPFLLAWGTPVYAKVLATNAYGNSAFSPVGSGNNIVTSPDAPVALAENTALRTSTAIGLTWTVPNSNGGTVVLDYRVSYD
jgi:hypothetical protein